MNTKNPEKLQIEYFFEAPPEVIWRSWTDPEMVEKWFGSDPNGIVLSAELSVWIGGTFEVCFRNSDGTQFTCFGEYTAVEWDKALSFTWLWKDSPKTVEFISVNLLPQNGGTTMFFEHSSIDQNSSHGYKEGWMSTFSKLERILQNLQEDES
jgi:uncharacterized protein YndB with AHSA1/START domain